MYLYSKHIDPDIGLRGKGKIISFSLINEDVKIEITFENSKTVKYYLKIALQKNALLVRQDKENNSIETYKIVNHFYQYGIPQNLDFLDESKLLNTLLKFGFVGFVHGADMKTVSKILESGYLCSRHYLQENNIEFTDAANQNVIVNTDEIIKKHTRFYYYPKTPTLYNMCQKHKICLLIFKWNLVKNYECFFSDGNNASKYTKIYKFEELDDSPNLISWKEIFERGSYNYEDDRINYEVKRRRNAEMLSAEKISLDYLDKIIFKSDGDKNELLNLISSTEKSKYELLFEVNSSKLD